MTMSHSQKGQKKEIRNRSFKKEKKIIINKKVFRERKEILDINIVSTSIAHLEISFVYKRALETMLGIGRKTIFHKGNSCQFEKTKFYEYSHF